MTSSRTQVFSLAEKYYSGWKAGYKGVEIEAEPPQTEKRSGMIEWPLPTRPYLAIGWHTPAFDATTPDTAALDLISQLLFSENAPLYQDLVVDRQLVDFIQGGAEFHRDPYLFTVVARARSDEAVSEVKAAVEQALEKLEAEPVDVERLERIKDHLRYQFALQLDSAPSVAVTVAEFLNLTGDPQTINRLYEQYQEVTPADIQRIAKQVFVDTNETEVELMHPPEKDSGTEDQSAQEGE